jgi:flavin-dependent dehydrogenase
MLVDVETGGREAFDRTFDVCVVGSGPAGMTVARRLAARGAFVALMEGGGRSFDEALAGALRRRERGARLLPA